MKVTTDGYMIECFENKRDYNNWLLDNSKDMGIINSTIYRGELYSIPDNVRVLFNENILVTIKKRCYNDVQYILIHK